MLVETMTKISDLPRDLLEEVLSRVPVTSLRAGRFTCTNWNALSKHQSFTQKQIGQAKEKQRKELLVIMTINSRVYLMSVDPRGLLIEDNVKSSIKRKGTLITLNGGDRVVHHKVLHCDGLLLCVTREKSTLVVWNPYCGQTRWIQPRGFYHWKDNYALGYGTRNKSHRSNKILRFLGAYDTSVELEIYDFDSNSWKVVPVTHRIIPWYQRGVTIKGNTYWSAQDDNMTAIAEFLICFDFTRERFGKRLPLPFNSNSEDTVILSSVREEQLAVLYHKWPTCWTEIWISNKIRPNVVSWHTKLFLGVQMTPLSATAASFFVDQENKVAVVLHNDMDHKLKHARNIAYIIGENDYFKEVDLGEASHIHSFSSVCSYAPSSVQMEQPAGRGKRKWNQVY